VAVAVDTGSRELCCSSVCLAAMCMQMLRSVQSGLPGTLRSIGLVCVLPRSQNLLEDSLPLAAINQKMPLAGSITMRSGGSGSVQRATELNM
jgi:hypothetical protein